MIRSKPAAPARVAYVGGRWDGREDVLDVPGGTPTIVPVDARLLTVSPAAIDRSVAFKVYRTGA